MTAGDTVDIIQNDVLLILTWTFTKQFLRSWRCMQRYDMGTVSAILVIGGIPLTKGQLCGKHSHVIASLWTEYCSVCYAYINIAVYLLSFGVSFLIKFKKSFLISLDYKDKALKFLSSVAINVTVFIQCCGIFFSDDLSFVSTLMRVGCPCGNHISISVKEVYEPLTRYIKLRIAHAPGIPGTFSPPPTSKETAS